MLPGFVLLALATFASEDLTCIAAGVMVAQGRIGYLEATLACLAGIFAGDLLLFLAGRTVASRALNWRMVARFLPRERVERSSAWLVRRGLAVVFISRFTPGLRLPTYVAAGLLAAPILPFAAYFLAASAVWTPALVGATALFGSELLTGFFASRHTSSLAFLSVFALAALALALVRPLLTVEGRRRFVGFWKRKLRWEFWPAWAAYLPAAPYILYLGLRYRSLTLFTAANPGIATGGLAGESKSRILMHLSRCPGTVADFDVIPLAETLPRKRALAAEFMQAHSFDFPIVLKPDRGERGAGVAVIRSEPQLESYLNSANDDTIIQRHIEGVEFGIFYVRHPSEPRGRITSITEKRFPAVTGNGYSTLRELILNDPRAVAMARVYEALSKRPAGDVPAAGESVQLVELGSHCRGAIFLDGSRYWSPALEDAIDNIAKAHPGFYFGRFDLRATSTAALSEGHSFQVIELNGVAAEATHIYDPSVSLLEAYRVMFRNWSTAFAIGDYNRGQGVEPMSLRALAGEIARHKRKEGATLEQAPASRPLSAQG